MKQKGRLTAGTLTWAGSAPGAREPLGTVCPTASLMCYKSAKEHLLRWFADIFTLKFSGFL